MMDNRHEKIASNSFKRYSYTKKAEASIKSYERDSALRKSQRSRRADKIRAARESKSTFEQGVSLFKVAVLLILFSVVLRVLGGFGDVPTLGSFLQMLSKAPSVPTDWISIINGGLSNGISIGWIKTIVQYFENTFTFLAWFAVGALNAVSYLSYFLRWLFGGM